VGYHKCIVSAVKDWLDGLEFSIVAFSEVCGQLS
jgi:hypothetical protein